MIQPHARRLWPRLPALALCLALAHAAAAQAPTGARSLVELGPGAISAAEVRALELDVASHDGVFLPGRATEVIAGARELAALDRQGVPYTVLAPDLEAFYRARLVPGGATLPAGGHGAWLTPPFAQGGMGGYYTWAEVESVLDQIHAAYPALTTQKASIGLSVEGRPLWMLKVSDNPNLDENEAEVRFDALHHAREPQGMQTTLWFLLWLVEEYGSDPLATYLVNQRELFFIPCVNPDGYVYNQQTNPGGGGLWRKNRRNNGGGQFGVDLNRNYASFWGFDDSGSSPSTSSETYRGPSPASEPEVASMQAFMAGRAFRTAQSNHTYSNLWLYPYGYAAVLPANDAAYLEVSSLATADNGYLLGPAATTLYLANGITSDHEHEVHGTMAWTPEIGSSADGFWPPTSRIVPLAAENLTAFQTTALAAGAFLRFDGGAEEVGDGDGYFEAGEAVVWSKVRNSGTLGSGAVTLALSSSSPWASVSVPLAVLPGLSAFSSATSATPVRLDLDPATPGGTAVDYTLTLTHDGYAQVMNGTLVAGELRPYLVDSLEVDRGWTAGVPGDTATTGIWERGDPIGTSSSGVDYNPEHDATAAPGVVCFMTGNGGGSAGTDDVDNGETTLLSPLFDLSGVGAARLSYERWYAISVDDSLSVELSSDGGASFVALETVSTHQNAWTRVDHDLAGLVPFTDRMQLRVRASDLGTASLTEAAIDELRLEVYDAAPRLHFYGPVLAGGSVQLNLSGEPGAVYALQWSSGVVASALGSAGGGSAGLAWNRTLPGQTPLVSGVIPPSGLAQRDFVVPQAPGETLYYRAVVRSGGTGTASNVAALPIP